MGTPESQFYRAIFSRFLGFLNRDGASALMEEWEVATPDDVERERALEALEGDPHLLVRRCATVADEEDAASDLLCLLWRACNRSEIGSARDLAAAHVFTELHNAWPVHRLLSQSGAGRILDLAVPGGRSTSYRGEIDRLRQSHQYGESVEENDLESYYALLLAICLAGDPSGHVRELAMRLLDYVVSRFDRTGQLNALDPVGVSLLLVDLQFPRAGAWPFYAALVSEAGPGTLYYPAYLVGRRYFGEPARAHLEGLGIPGGMTLLDRLA